LALNDATPRGEWTEGPDGKLRGPWQAQHIAYLLAPGTMDKYSFPTGTIGGARCVGELVDKVRWMRRYRGAHVYPVVALSDVFMNTRFGGRQRPHFAIKRWIMLGGEGMALPSPRPGELEKPTEVAATSVGVKTVEAPKLAEEMNDDIPFDGGKNKSGREAVLMPPV
jgi:hypothetical protein